MNEDGGRVKDVLDNFEDFQHVFLATVDEDEPRVRPVTLIPFEDRFWITTDTGSRKVEQIKSNSNVECSFIYEGDRCLRIRGRVRIVKDREIRVKIAEHCDFFSDHWNDIDDPEFTLLEVILGEIEDVSLLKTITYEI